MLKLANEMTDKERRVATILNRFLNEVKEPMETINFLSRIVAEDEKGNVPIYNEEGHSNEEDITIDPGSGYLCDLCGHFMKGREGKRLNNGIFICNWCRGQEMMDVIPKEGE